MTDNLSNASPIEEDLTAPIEDSTSTAEKDLVSSVEDSTAPVEEDLVSSVEDSTAPVEENLASPIEDSTPPVEDSTAPIEEDLTAPIEDFDWDAYAEGDTYSKESREKLTETYDSTLSKINDKEVVTGIVTSMSKREVVVNIGYKSDGVVSMNEFRYNPALKLGDEVEVYIESQEDKNGQLLLSHKKARASRAWDRVNAALENNEIIKGYIKCRTKGGMIEDVFSIEAFLPGSQIGV